MPHEGHTTIEFSGRSPQPHPPTGGHHPAGGHESPMGHRGPLAGAHSSTAHGGHAGIGTHHARVHTNGKNGGSGARLLSPHQASGRSRTPSPHRSNTNPHNSPNNSHPNGNHFINHGRSRRDLSADAAIPQPLLEKDASNSQPPLADDLYDDSDIPKTADAPPGVDDALFGSPTRGEGEGVEEDACVREAEWERGDTEDEEKKEGDEDDKFLPGITTRFGSERPFPITSEFATGAVLHVTPDMNVYQQKKNLAQGMMDLALLSANANQLRYVLEAGSTYHPYYIPSLIFISASLILQVAVGVGLIVNGTYNVTKDEEIRKADKINNLTVIGIFLITVVNVFIASFGVSQLPSSGRS